MAKAPHVSPLEYLLRTTKNRLMKHVKINMGGCWEWVGDHTSSGYGVAWLAGRRFIASRVFYEMENGIGSADGVMMCHKCDNPRCVNPDHLFAGTQADNMADAKEKGRMQRGEDRPLHKLTVSDVSLIRSRANIMSMRAQAREFGVTHETIRKILNGLMWAS